MNKRHLTPALAAASLFLSAAGGSALAQCPAGHQLPAFPDPGNAGWEMEGPLQAYDLAARTLTVFGAKLEVPAGLIMETQGAHHITLETFLDPELNAKRSVLGGTVIAVGTTADPDGDGCINLIADEVYFEFSEDVLVTPFAADALDLQSGIFHIAGMPARMNTDPRFGSVILDASGNEDITLAHLQGFEGTLIGAEGYFEGDTLRVSVLETSAYAPNPNGDNVIIEVARWRDDKQRLRVSGRVVPSGATYVDIYAPGVANAELSACIGTLLGKATVGEDPEHPGEIGFEFESTGELTQMPEKVCVQSANGGANRRTVDLRDAFLTPRERQEQLEEAAEDAEEDAEGE